MKGQLLDSTHAGKTSFSSLLQGQNTVKLMASGISKCGAQQLGSVTWVLAMCGSWIIIPDITAIKTSNHGLVLDLALWKSTGWHIAKYLKRIAIKI